MRLILYSFPFFFQIHKSRLYFSNDEFFPLKFNESFVNWRIVSMSPVQILKIKVLFTKIWLKIKVLFYFKSFSFVSSCINEDSYDLFSLKTLFLFPFHSVFHSVPFSIPFSVPRFSNTLNFTRLSLKLQWAFLIACCPSSVRQSVNFSHVDLLLQNHFGIFTQLSNKTLFGYSNEVYSREGSCHFPRGYNSEQRRIQRRRAGPPPPLFEIFGNFDSITRNLTLL